MVLGMLDFILSNMAVSCFYVRGSLSLQTCHLGDSAGGLVAELDEYFGVKRQIQVYA